MSITALNATGQQTRSIDKNPRLFLNVITWEFRRFFASRLFWYQALGLSGLLLLMIWALHSPDNFSVNAGGGSRGNGEFLSGFVAGTSAGGLLHALPIVLLVTTALPTWAYVWGRYLAGLVISLGLALLLLVSILGMGGLLHLAVADYPLPQIGAVLLLWIGMVLSAVILVSSVGFALCTLLPRLSTLVKVVIVVAWLVGALVIPLSLGDTTTPPTWWVNWDPTSGITVRGLLPSYTINPGPAITSEAQFQQFILSVENKMPDLTGWFVPHLLLASLSLLLVLIAALAFKRSRDMLN